MRLEDARPWLHKAAEDLEVVSRLSPILPRVPVAVCFHCQQAAEKALKAVIAAHHLMPPRTHDMATVARILRSRGHFMEGHLRIGVFSLNSYAVQSRYPGFGLEPNEEDAREAIEVTGQILRWCVQELGVTASAAELAAVERPPFDTHSRRALNA